MRKAQALRENRIENETHGALVDRVQQLLDANLVHGLSAEERAFLSDPRNLRLAVDKDVVSVRSLEEALRGGGIRRDQLRIEEAKAALAAESHPDVNEEMKRTTTGGGDFHTGKREDGTREEWSHKAIVDGDTTRASKEIRSQAEKIMNGKEAESVLVELRGMSPTEVAAKRAEIEALIAEQNRLLRDAGKPELRVVLVETP